MTYSGDDFADIPEDSRIREVAQSEVFNQSVRFQNEWQNILLDAGWQSTGEGINSITIDPQREGSDSYTIGSDKIQILISEFGRRPGAKPPPPDSLADWVHEQEGLLNRGETETRDFGDGPVTVTFDAVVYLIGQAIAENGIAPIQAARRAWKNVDGEYEKNVERKLSESE